MQSSAANMSTAHVKDGRTQGWGTSRSIRIARQCKTHACAAEMMQGLAPGRGCRGTAVSANQDASLGNARARSRLAARPGLLARCKETHLARGLTSMIVKPAQPAPPWRWDGRGKKPSPKGRRGLHGRKTRENLEDRGSNHTGGALTGPGRAKSAQGAPSGFIGTKSGLDPGLSSWCQARPSVPRLD